MRRAVIDVGSNTIRTVIYDVKPPGFQIIHNERDFAGIIGYIKDNSLTSEGAERLAASLEKTARVCRRLCCDDISCFATASLRNINNGEEAVEEIFLKSGVRIKIISGEEEILYDLAGLLSAVDISDGIGLDLGGGSCQIFTFKDRKLLSSVSLPIGSLRLYEKFSGKSDIASCAEEYAARLLSDYGEFRSVGFDEVYAIGGTARVAAKVCAELMGGGDKTIRARDIDALLSPDTRPLAEEIIKKISPERINSLFTGCAALRAVCRYTGAEIIRVVRAGVREGFLYSVILQNQGTGG